MAIRTDTLDLSALRLTTGEGATMQLGLVIEPLQLGGHTYTVTHTADAEATVSPEDQVAARLDISRMTGDGYALQLNFRAHLQGPCMRCLEPAEPDFRVKAREVSQPGEDDEEMQSPYVIETVLDVNAWAHDALVLALPTTLLCAPDCLGLCAVCGENLNTAGPEHVHEAEPDPRWAALSELTFADPETAAPEAQSETAVAESEPAPDAG
jgi:uncharacterized protein